MKKIISAVALATVATGAWAQVPDLSDALGDLSSAELQDFNDSLTEAPSVITEDLQGTLDVVLVNEALDQGLITESEASQLEGALAIIEKNEDFFNFDLQGLLTQLLDAGFITPQEISDTLQVFDTLTDGDKSIVGDEEFRLYTPGGCSGIGAGLTGCTATVNSDLSPDGVTKLGGADAFDLDEQIAIVDAAYNYCESNVCSNSDIATIQTYITANNLAPAFEE